jgi:CelD/BcsL family acetyltransferase involved in cellulose biosynthesis
MRHAWFEAWWNAFGQGGELRICVAWRGKELGAVLPLHARTRHRLEAMANWQVTPVFTPLTRDGRALETVAAAALAESSVLEMWGVPAHSDTLAGFGAAAARAKRILSIDQGEIQPITNTRGAFDDYRQTMKHGWREIERRRRKLLREHDASFKLIDTGGDWDQELDRGLTLEVKGWKGDRRTAVLSSDLTERFYRSIVRDLHERGEFAPSSLWVDGRMVAFDLALVHDSRYYLLKTAYDEELREHGPGLSLRLSVIERCFELGLDAHEFLGLDMPWKRLFSTDEREHRVLRAYARRPLPLLQLSVRRGAPAAARSAYHRLRAWPDARARRRSREAARRRAQ